MLTEANRLGGFVLYGSERSQKTSGRWGNGSRGNINHNYNIKSHTNNINLVYIISMYIKRICILSPCILRYIPSSL